MAAESGVIVVRRAATRALRRFPIFTRLSQHLRAAWTGSAAASEDSVRSSWSNLRRASVGGVARGRISRFGRLQRDQMGAKICPASWLTLVILRAKGPECGFGDTFATNGPCYNGGWVKRPHL
jgi:hypothetical protein